MSSEEFKEMLLVRQLADENRRCREAYKLQKLIEIKKKAPSKDVSSKVRASKYYKTFLNLL